MRKLKQLIESGFSISKAANILNIDYKQAKDIINKNNYSLTIEDFNDSKIPIIKELYKQGVSAKQLGYKYKIDKRRILKWVKEEGLLRSSNDSKRVIFFDQHKFDIIDTREKAYWLGFFYADAYNSERTNTFVISLSDKDYNHLAKLANFVQLPISKIKRTVVKGHKICTLKLYSKHLCNVMKLHGCSSAKSFTITYPTNFIDKKLHNHFIRGLFDGDGSISKNIKNGAWKLNLASTKQCNDSIAKIIYKETGIKIKSSYISKTNNNTYLLEQGGNNKVKAIMDWIYSGSNVNCRLDRKFEKHKELLLQQIKKKTCTKCNNTFNISNFRLRKGENNLKYYVSKCIPCEREQKRVLERRRYNNLTREQRDIINKRSAISSKKESYRQWHREWQKNKEENDIDFKLKRRVSSLLRHYINKKGANSFDLFDYTKDELKIHIESLFEPWMNWDNWGAYKASEWNDDDSSTWKWHIDHIIPQSSFKYKSVNDVEFKECWKLSNLRPLSAKANIEKGNKIIA
jgi:hypothetical protein